MDEPTHDASNKEDNSTPSTPADEETSNSSELTQEGEKDPKQDNKKLLNELKARLREIEELKHKLHLDEGTLSPIEKEAKEKNYTPEKVREAVEELVVPPLELLEDKPNTASKKKKEAIS